MPLPEDTSVQPANDDFHVPVSNSLPIIAPRLPIPIPTPSSSPSSDPTPAQCPSQSQILTPPLPVPCTATIPPILPPQVLPSCTVPRIKEVKCEMFTGKGQYPGLGAGFDLFMCKFEQAIQIESRRNNSAYTDELREAFLVTCIDGAASDFYFQFYDEFLDANGRIPTYQEVQIALRAEFRCKLSQARLSDCLNKHSKPEQTWHGYYTYRRW